MDKTEFLAFFCTAWLAIMLSGVKGALKDILDELKKGR
jgi:hypothetical protein